MATEETTKLIKKAEELGFELKRANTLKSTSKGYGLISGFNLYKSKILIASFPDTKSVRYALIALDTEKLWVRAGKK